MRRLYEYEKNAIKEFINKSIINEKFEYVKDIENMYIDIELSSNSRLVFHIDGYGTNNFIGQHPLSAEGKMFDRDGEELMVFLHVDKNNRLHELEFIKLADGGNVLSPLWETLIVY